jgi:hypothetical protein
MMQRPTAAVLFSGHNDRAVIALCRYFADVGLPFYIVSIGEHDAIFKTAWAARVIWKRSSPTLDLPLMACIYEAIKQQGQVPVLCPTSEFLNRFALEHEDVLRHHGWHWTLPAPHIYLRLSDKSSSPPLMQALAGLDSPPLQPVGAWEAPCVLKPVRNVLQGCVRYPLLCRTASELATAKLETNNHDWFAQTWVEGQSHYLCAYLDAHGGWDAFWQTNLVQQPNGKSIVLACTGDNPGVDTTRLMQGLQRLGYRGPFMMEVIRDDAGTPHFIEVNPRFWGPLELCRVAHPALLQRFVCDITDSPSPPTSTGVVPDAMYAWAFGARQHPWRIYPAARKFSTVDVLHQLQTHDVYAGADTHALSHVY